MKEQTKNICQLCGKARTIIISNKYNNERLCLQCLVSTYPVLKELRKVM